MNLSLFVIALGIAILGPWLAVRYMRPVLQRILQTLCSGSDSAAEFWVRSAYILAISGTVILIMLFGNFSAGANVVDMLHRSLLLVCCGVFVSIALIARNIWKQVLAYLNRQKASLPPPLPEEK